MRPIALPKEPIYMAGPHITEADVRIVEDAMRHGWYGEKAYWYVEELQRQFAKYHGRKFAIMTPNCTTSIHLLLTGLGVKAGDEVIVPECTWIATAAPITYLGATPIFCDIDPVDWCLDPASVERAITPKTKAVIAVDLYGNMPRMDELREITERHGIPLIEDAAEALGSKYKGVKAGKFGVGSVFSFHRTKTLTTGEGGMLLLDDERLYQRCMFLRDHGRVAGVPYFNSEVTYKYMPFNIQAAIGYAQFLRLDELIGIKRRIFESFKRHLSDVPGIEFNAEPEHVFNGVWVPAIVLGKEHGVSKAEAMARLEKLGLPSRPFFYPLSHLPAYPGAEQIYRQRNPMAYDISSRGLNLPCAMNLTDAQIAAYSDGIRSILGR